MIHEMFCTESLRNGLLFKKRRNQLILVCRAYGVLYGGVPVGADVITWILVPILNRPTHLLRVDTHDTTLADLSDTYHRTYRPDNTLLYRMSDLVHSSSGSKAANPTSSQAETKETSSLSKSAAFALLLASLNIFKEVAGKTSVPGLQEGVKALVVILDVMQVCLSFKYIDSRCGY